MTENIGPCSTDKRGLWDADASLEEHRTGAWICNRRCPIRAWCETYTEKTKRPEGLYAGMMLDHRGTRSTVEEYHASSRRQSIPLEPTRVCALPECTVVFPVTPKIRHKKYCRQQHGDEARSRAKQTA